MKGLLGAQEWVVPRRECQYRRQDFTALPPRKRAAAAQLAAARFLPAADARIHLAWQDGIAHYWIWTPSADSAAHYRRWLPETLLYPPPAASGMRLLTLCDGVEGQLWRDGVLVASQWWPQIPASSEWTNFQRAAGVMGDTEVPAPETLEWLDQPWARSGSGLFIDAAMAERLAWAVSGCLLLAVLAWQLTSLLRWNAAAAEEAVRVEAARAKAAPLLAQRDRAEEAVAQIESLRNLEPAFSDYEWMARVAAALPQGSQLAGWIREPARLRVLVRSSETDPRRFIEAFVNLPPFNDLTATTTGAGDMLLEFELPQPDAGTEAVQ